MDFSLDFFQTPGLQTAFIAHCGLGCTQLKWFICLELDLLLLNCDIRSTRVHAKWFSNLSIPRAGSGTISNTSSCSIFPADDYNYVYYTKQNKLRMDHGW